MKRYTLIPTAWPKTYTDIHWQMDRILDFIDEQDISENSDVSAWISSYLMAKEQPEEEQMIGLITLAWVWEIIAYDNTEEE